MYSSETKKRVAEQIINMLENDVLQGCGIESFEGWCEDGDVFDYDEDCIALMKEIAADMDKISYKLDIYER